MSRITMKSKKMQLILKTIKEEGTATSRQLIDRTLITKPMTTLILRTLRELKLIYVSGYVMTNGSSITRVFSAGDKPDAVRTGKVEKVKPWKKRAITCDVAASWLYNPL